MTQNLDESLHLININSSPSEWDTRGTLHTKGTLDITKGTLDIYDRTEKGKFAFLLEKMFPVLTGFMTAYIAILGSLLAHHFNLFQANNAAFQRYQDRAIQASGTRQKVLTDYSERISDLTKESNFASLSNDPNIKLKLKGETLIALRRLDDNGEGEKLISNAERKITQLNQTPFFNFIESTDTLRGFDDADELKGLLVRFLFESELLTRDEQIVDLSGANITRVNLNYAPLPNIDLKGAWLTSGTFLNADLRRANLSGTDLKEADLRGANLQGADLTDVKLQKADLRGIDLQTTDGTVPHITNLREADLRGANLQGVNLTDADLEKADLRGNVLRKTDGTVLRTTKTDLRGADLTGTNLSGACYHKDTTKGLDNIDPQVLKTMRNATNERPDVACKDLP